MSGATQEAETAGERSLRDRTSRWSAIHSANVVAALFSGGDGGIAANPRTMTAVPDIRRQTEPVAEYLAGLVRNAAPVAASHPGEQRG